LPQSIVTIDQFGQTMTTMPSKEIETFPNPAAQRGFDSQSNTRG